MKTDSLHRQFALFLSCTCLFALACDSQGTVLRPGPGDEDEASANDGGAADGNEAEAGGDVEAGATDVLPTPRPIPDAVRLAAADLCRGVSCGAGTCLVERGAPNCKCAPGAIQWEYYPLGRCFPCETVSGGTVDVGELSTTLPNVSVKINNQNVPIYFELNDITVRTRLLPSGGFAYVGPVSPGIYKIKTGDPADSRVDIPALGTVSTIPIPASVGPEAPLLGGTRIELRPQVVPVEVFAEDNTSSGSIRMASHDRGFKFYDDDGNEANHYLVGRHWVAFEGDVLGEIIVKPAAKPGNGWDMPPRQDFHFKTNKPLQVEYQVTFTGVPKTVVIGGPAKRTVRTGYDTVAFSFDQKQLVTWEVYLLENTEQVINMVPLKVTANGGEIPSSCSLELSAKGAHFGFKSSGVPRGGIVWIPWQEDFGALEADSYCGIYGQISEADVRSGKFDFKLVQPAQTKLIVKIDGQPLSGTFNIEGRFPSQDGSGGRSNGFINDFTNGGVVMIYSGQSRIKLIASSSGQRWVVDQALFDQPENIVDIKLVPIKARVRSTLPRPLGVEGEPGAQPTWTFRMPLWQGASATAAAPPNPEYANFNLQPGSYLFFSTSPFWQMGQSHGCFIVPP